MPFGSAFIKKGLGMHARLTHGYSHLQTGKEKKRNEPTSSRDDTLQRHLDLSFSYFLIFYFLFNEFRSLSKIYKSVRKTSERRIVFQVELFKAYSKYRNIIFIDVYCTLIFIWGQNNKKNILLTKKGFTNCNMRKILVWIDVLILSGSVTYFFLWDLKWNKYIIKTSFLFG